jgi:hypothetical protein
MEIAVILGSMIVSGSIVFAAIIAAFGERREPGPVGRYRIFPVGEGTCFLLDTRTGRLWEKTGSSGWSEQAEAPWVAPALRRKTP